MKKLEKLQINPEKFMRNEELTSLRGGYDASFICRCGFCTGYTSGCINVSAPTLEEALQAMGGVCQGAGATCNDSDMGCPQNC